MASLLENLLVGNIIRAFRPGFASGRYYIRPDDQKITQFTTIATGDEGEVYPWIHIRPDPTRFCRFYQDVFTYMGFIHSRCLNCWKVVIKPRTVWQLIDLHELLATKMARHYSKCGIERRKYVHANYGGYIYCNILAEAKARHAEIRDEIAQTPSLASLLKERDPEGRLKNVIIKRYCTEFELKAGDSAEYKRPPIADRIEAKMKERFDLPVQEVPQPEELKEEIMANWIEFAWERDDPTAALCNDGPLYTPPRVYHDPETEEKDDDEEKGTKKGTGERTG